MDNLRSALKNKRKSIVITIDPPNEADGHPIVNVQQPGDNQEQQAQQDELDPNSDVAPEGDPQQQDAGQPQDDSQVFADNIDGGDNMNQKPRSLRERAKMAFMKKKQGMK